MTICLPGVLTRARSGLVADLFDAFDMNEPGLALPALKASAIHVEQG
jgi:hypothetical protein